MLEITAQNASPNCFPQGVNGISLPLEKAHNVGAAPAAQVFEDMSVTSRRVLLARARSFLMEALGLPSRNVNLALRLNE